MPRSPATISEPMREALRADCACRRAAYRLASPAALDYHAACQTEERLTFEWLAPRPGGSDG